MFARTPASNLFDPTTQLPNYPTTQLPNYQTIKLPMPPKQKPVRVRFAPSPTGRTHLGSGRT
ncbi:MAG: hypothetical protein U9Q82_05475, partial [Chloroflexota bacterium]|nr:hypothetical protein [Chloroflexota bacterium]